MYGYIYLTTDLQTGKIYVGQKKSDTFLGDRYLGSGTLLNRIIKSADDRSRFKVQMIDTAESKEELDSKEIYWIKEKDSRNPDIGYNLAEGGSTNSGFKQSDKQKQAASTYMSNRIVSDVTRTNMSNAAKNRVVISSPIKGYEWITNGEEERLVSQETLQKLFSCGFNYGRLPMSEEHKNELKDKYANSEYIIKDNICILVTKDDLPQYLQSGWIIGRNCYSEQRNKNVGDGKRGTIRIIHSSTGKVKYIKPDKLNEFKEQGYITSKEYMKKTQWIQGNSNNLFQNLVFWQSWAKPLVKEEGATTIESIIKEKNFDE